MRILISVLTVAFIFLDGPVRAADSWGIDHEKVERFDAKVVDILCELTGDCPADCGAGKRQLGLIRDGKLILVAKNNDIFAGAADEIEVRLATKRNLTADEEGNITEWVRKKLGYPFEIRFAYFDELPFTKAGKFKDFVIEFTAST